ncbi:MAG: PhoH family protein [bacterium]|nr:PhoH family protein [bacterium]
MAKLRISLKGVEPLTIFGERDENLRLLSKNYDSKIVLRGEDVILQGEPDKLSILKEEILSLIKKSKAGRGLINQTPTKEYTGAEVLVTPKCIVKPRTTGQVQYLKALDKFDIVACIGPAGTGKTYLAVAKAVDLLRKGAVHRVILTRPAVEAGERLGFLPGDFKEKIDPYLRPLYDALYELMPYDKIKHYIEERVIEIAPLAYMRGRNLDNSFVILDEGQNTQKIQMKMFLTRLGIGSRTCITGDVTQIDLQDSKESGLLHIQRILSGISGIKFVWLSEKDIVRHPLVRKIVKAYEKEAKH